MNFDKELCSKSRQKVTVKIVELMLNSSAENIELLAKWPVNTQKTSRDYGYHLRTLLKLHKADGNFFPGKAADTEKKLNSVLRLAENKYGHKYPSTAKIGASGMERNDVAIVLTDEFIDYFNNNRGFLKEKYSA